MRSISNPSFFIKHVIFPVFFIFGVTLSATWLFAPHIFVDQATPFAIRFIAALGTIIGGTIIFRFWLSFADEVLDAGDEIIVCKSGYREYIPLTNVISLIHKSGRLPYSVLTLYTPCRFGRKIIFFTKLTLYGFFRSSPDPAIYDNLTMRINEARRLPKKQPGRLG